MTSKRKYEPRNKVSHKDEELELPRDSTNKLSNKELFAEAFVETYAGGLPSCPACAKILEERHLNSCDYCGFSFQHLEKLFPSDQLPPLEPILDFSNKLNDKDKELILDSIALIQQRYPQFHPKVCLLPLQSDIPVQNMALWMLNQCPPLEGEQLQDKEWTILLLINTTKRRCALAYGYQAENFIPSVSAYQLVSSFNRSIRRHNLGYMISDLLNDLVPILDRSKRLVKRLFRRFKKSKK